jgi:hypothetical protein
MKIAVCGCSFSAISHLPQYKGTHWSEILADKLEAELISYARQGIGNNVIRLQIDEAIAAKADWVFIGSTTEDRIEFPMNKFKKINDGSPNHSAYPENQLGYKPELGLKNFNYGDAHPYTMIAETLFSVIDNSDHNYRIIKVDKNTRIAVEGYAAFLYDAHWKRQVDNWVLQSGLWRLHELKIKFLFNPWISAVPNAKFEDIPSWFVQQYYLSNDFAFGQFCKQYPHEPNIDPGYHTSPQGQQAIAEKYFNKIKELS